MANGGFVALRTLNRAVVAVLVLSGSAAAQTAVSVQTLRPASIMEAPRGDSVVVASVPLGAVLPVVEERVDWYLVELPTGLGAGRGWISRQFIEVVQRAPSPVVAPGAPRGGPRAFLVVNGSRQFGTNSFSDGATKRENAENGRFDADYVVEGGPAFDVAAGATLWRGLGMSVGASRFSVSTPASLRGAIPHPFFFNQPRAVSGEIPGLKREELAVHVQARGVYTVGRLQLMAFGGPSFYQVKQTVVADYSYDESYPYDSAVFRAASTTVARVNKVGYNAGGDVAFFFTRHLGAGATVQVTRALLDLPGALGGTREVEAGGPLVGLGLRVRF